MNNQIKLHPDHIKELAKKHNCSGNQVRLILHGNYNSELAISIRKEAIKIQKKQIATTEKDLKK